MQSVIEEVSRVCSKNGKVLWGMLLTKSKNRILPSFKYTGESIINYIPSSIIYNKITIIEENKFIDILEQNSSAPICPTICSSMPTIKITKPQLLDFLSNFAIVSRFIQIIKAEINGTKNP